MAKRKAPASSAKAAPAKGRPTKAEAAKAALKARQPDLLDAGPHSGNAIGVEADGRRVRCLARRPTSLTSRVGTTTEVVQGDVL